MEDSASEKLVKSIFDEATSKMQKESESETQFVTRKEFAEQSREIASQLSVLHENMLELTSLLRGTRTSDQNRAISPSGDKDEKDDSPSSRLPSLKSALAPAEKISSDTYSRSRRKSRGRTPDRRRQADPGYESDEMDQQERAFAERFGGIHDELQAQIRGKPKRSQRDSFVEFSEDEFDQPKSSAKDRRRKSILNAIVSVPESITNKVLYTATQPPYDHIRLNKRTPNAIMLFVQKYHRYLHLHNIEISMTKLISESVANMVIAGTKGVLDEETYYQLPNKTLLGLLMEPVRPKDKTEFIRFMNDYVQFELPKGYVPTSEDFLPLYHQLLVYRKAFKDMFDLLAENNEANVPKINNREDGIVKLFTSKVPNDYAANIVRSFDVTYFDTLEEFLVTFYIVVQKHFEDYNTLELNRQKFKKSSSTSSASALPASRPSAHDKFKSPPPYHDRRQSSYHRPQHRVSHIREVHDDIDGDSLEDDRVQSMIDAMTKASDMKYDYPPSEDEAVTVRRDDEDEPSLPPVPFAAVEDDGEVDFNEHEMVKRHINQLAAINAQASGKTGQTEFRMPNGCYQAVLHNKCLKTSCSYSHESAVLTRTHVAIQKLLNESIYRPKGQNPVMRPKDLLAVHDRHQKQILRRPPAAGGDFSNMMMVTPESVDNDRMFAPSFGETLRQMTLAALPMVSHYSLMHREGVIDLPGAVRLPVLKVLFDTGALHGSYIHSTFVDKHEKLFKPFIQHCNTIVSLADKKTTLVVKRCVKLNMIFIGDDDVEHAGKVLFYVLDECANDMIVGLPEITRYFSVLLKQMIDCAVDSIDPHSVAVIDSVPILADKDKLAPDTVYPWSIPIEAEAPEDLQTELPCSFPDALHFMEMSPEEALEEYLSLIPKHVSPQFIEATDIVNLLKTKGARVFVPQNWDGINGIPPLVLKLKEGMPATMKPKPRSINPKLYDHAFKEFQRLRGYFYVPSTSPIASCLVIAPKATPPFIRFCGDYTGVNKYIMIGHYPIPHVQRSLEKITAYKIFLDFDFVNAFHQIRLAEETSELLSVQTPWGQVQPVFLPEGVAPATGVLQSMSTEIFGDLPWVIAIFDNLLVLAYDYEDAYKKVDIILDRCIKRNIYLKMSKTWLGFTEANFFGYVCRHGCYELSQDRKDSLKAIPFPKNTKQMQSFLGAALFFKSFVPSYSTLTAPLNDMIKTGFNWDPATWKVDYPKIFDEFKTQLQEAQAIFYPDYSLTWILRTDASLHGVGAVLLQVFYATPESEPVYQPIAFVSQKFSEQATRWSTIEQECFGLYFGVKSFDYYLRCKPFILETDHNNLLWIEHSMIPKVIRWRVFLQSFVFQLRHIAGKLNTFADWLSRAHESDSVPSPSTLAVQLSLLSNIFAHDQTLSDSSDNSTPLLSAVNVDASAATEPVSTAPLVVPADPPPDKATAMFRQVHGGRMGHFGARETWRMLNKYFPGHQLPYKVIAELVATCAVCQKDRLGMLDVIAPVIRHLKQTHKRAMIGLDTLMMTPMDKDGFCLLIVIVNFFTKHVALYPGKDHSALTVATALFQYCCTYGLIDAIITDPGSEFMNEVVEHLLKWLGIPNHRVSLVDRHESNGVEGTNKLVLRFLKALVMDERVKDRWSSPTVLPLVQFLLNSRDSSETGIVPFHAHFGSADATYFRMPEGGDDLHRAHAYVKLLDSNLRLLSDISNKYQENLAKERTAKTPVEKQNMYQPGDLILFQLNPNEPLPSKLTPKFYGPYEVISQVKNDITCKHIILGHIKVFHVTRVKMFHGSLSEAKRMAMLDNDQYVIKKFVAYRGNPDIRTTMEFEVLFEDGSLVWLPWSKDIFETSQYEDYCRSRPELFTLVHDVKTAAKLLQDLRKSPITEVEPGDIVFVDLRSYGATWYASLPLPDLHHIQYVLEYKYVKWVGSTKRKIDARCDVFRERFDVDHVFVRRYGSQKVLLKDDNTVLIDATMVRKYPSLLPGYKPNADA